MVLLAGYLVVVTVVAAALYWLGAIGRACTLLGDPEVSRTPTQTRRIDRRFALINLVGGGCHLVALGWLVGWTRAGHELMSWPVLLGVVPFVTLGLVVLQAGVRVLHGGAAKPA